LRSTEKWLDRDYFWIYDLPKVTGNKRELRKGG